MVDIEPWERIGLNWPGNYDPLFSLFANATVNLGRGWRFVKEGLVKTDPVRILGLSEGKSGPTATLADEAGEIVGFFPLGCINGIETWRIVFDDEEFFPIIFRYCSPKPEKGRESHRRFGLAKMVLSGKQLPEHEGDEIGPSLIVEQLGILNEGDDVEQKIFKALELRGEGKNEFSKADRNFPFLRIVDALALNGDQIWKYWGTGKLFRVINKEVIVCGSGGRRLAATVHSLNAKGWLSVDMSQVGGMGCVTVDVDLQELEVVRTGGALMVLGQIEMQRY